MTALLTVPVPDTGAVPDPLAVLRDDYAPRWRIEPCALLGGDWLTARPRALPGYSLTTQGVESMRCALEDFDAGRWRY